jgi:hypothetical protein
VTKTAFIRFKGWAVIRLPTDPDPADEPRGASGYTFAFAGEPDLDRVLRFQPNDTPDLVRPGAPWPASDWGVNIFDVFTLENGTKTPVTGMAGTRVQLNGDPKLENRNWLFTLPGWEPIVPFDLSIGAAPTGIRRTAPLTPNNTPVYQVPTAALMAQGAKGINLEPETLGTATGFWDAPTMLQQRAQTLKGLIANENDPVKKTCLVARLAQVNDALAGLLLPPNPNNTPDRRVVAHYAVERFNVMMNGPNATVPTQGPLNGLNAAVPWMASFYIGGWDCDLLAAWVQGSIRIPFL